MVRGGSGAVVPERHQLPQVRPIANDLRVSLDIGHGGRVVSELAEVGQPAGFWKVFDRFRHRHDVKRASFAANSLMAVKISRCSCRKKSSLCR